MPRQLEKHAAGWTGLQSRPQASHHHKKAERSQRQGTAIQSSSVGRSEFQTIGQIVEEFQPGRFAISQSQCTQAGRSDRYHTSRSKTDIALKDRANDAAMANNKQVLTRISSLIFDDRANAVCEGVPIFASRRCERCPPAIQDKQPRPGPECHRSGARSSLPRLFPAGFL